MNYIIYHTVKDENVKAGMLRAIGSISESVNSMENRIVVGNSNIFEQTIGDMADCIKEYLRKSVPNEKHQLHIYCYSLGEQVDDVVIIT